jgi:uncharacterized phage-associated protein
MAALHTTIMLIHTHREKLINSIVFFAWNTKHCGKVKLFKLLYLLDFNHFRETGRSVTNADYLAWKMGPVPSELVQEWDEPEADLAQAFDIVPQKVIDYTRELVVAKVQFDDSQFTKRELRIMQELANRFRDDYAMPMVNVTHQERGPWAKIWDEGRGNNTRIPYVLAVPDDDPNRDAILQAAHEREGILAGSRQHH